MKTLETVTAAQLVALKAIEKAGQPIFGRNDETNATLKTLHEQGYVSYTAGVHHGNFIYRGAGYLLTRKGEREITLSQCAADQPRPYSDAAAFKPLESSHVLSLTPEQAESDYALLRFDTDIAGGDGPVVALCEPQPWATWLEVGSLAAVNIYEQGEDEMEPVGKQLWAVRAGYLGRVVKVTRTTLELELVGKDTDEYAVIDTATLRDIWTVVRAVRETPKQA